ncbi:MAG: hypothetical protein IKQ35_00030 [Bacilli bacterium]|nr:hypothetical protein [Bacilli bacterium]
MPKKEEKRVVGIKNYIILLAICVITIVIAFGIRQRYLAYQEYELSKSVLKDKINEVSSEELTSYIYAHPDAILYVQVNEDSNSRSVGKKLYKVLKKRNLLNDSVYINLGNVSNKKEFYEEFNNTYTKGTEFKLNNYPALIIFDEGKIRDMVSKDKNKTLDIGDIEQLFENYEMDDSE